MAKRIIMSDDDRVGANIACAVCGARPYPVLGPPGTRQDFDLMKLKESGAPAGQGKGAWYCSRHLARVADEKYQIKAEAVP
jgi:hypothetical protein